MRIGSFTPAFKRLAVEPGRIVGVDRRGQRFLLPRFSWAIMGALTIVEKSDGLKSVLHRNRWAVSELKKYPHLPPRPIPSAKKPLPDRVKAFDTNTEAHPTGQVIL